MALTPFEQRLADMNATQATWDAAHPTQAQPLAQANPIQETSAAGQAGSGVDWSQKGSGTGGTIDPAVQQFIDWQLQQPSQYSPSGSVGGLWKQQGIDPTSAYAVNYAKSQMALNGNRMQNFANAGVDPSVVQGTVTPWDTATTYTPGKPVGPNPGVASAPPDQTVGHGGPAIEVNPPPSTVIGPSVGPASGPAAGPGTVAANNYGYRPTMPAQAPQQGALSQTLNMPMFNALYNDQMHRAFSGSAPGQMQYQPAWNSSSATAAPAFKKGGSVPASGALTRVIKYGT